MKITSHLKNLIHGKVEFSFAGLLAISCAVGLLAALVIPVTVH